MLIAQPDGCRYLLSAGINDLLAKPLPPKKDISLIYIEFVGRRIILHVNKRCGCLLKEGDSSPILYSFHLPGRVCLILSIKTQLFLTGAILFDLQTSLWK